MQLAVTTTHGGDDILSLCVAELVKRFRQKSLSPREAAAASLRRIEELNPVVNAFCLVDPERTLKDAEESEKRWLAGAPLGPLDGVPTSVKDLVLTRGWPTLRGSLATAERGDWDEDAPAVARLRENGAVLVGKTTTSEFGWKGVTDSPRHGITRNPWRTDRTTGGSSGGAAAAALLGMGLLHLGTDAGGSIRIPAGFTGVFGHKPTYGRVPAFPLSPFGTIAHLGPITRCVEDTAWMMNAIARPDSRDWAALPDDRCDYRHTLSEGITGLKIAYSPTLGYASVDAEVARLVQTAVEGMEKLGAHVEEVENLFDDPIATINTLWAVGAARVGARLTDDQRSRIEPALRDLMDTGAAVTLARYLDAQDQRENLGRLMSLFFQSYDLLVTPTLPMVAFAAGKLVPDARQASWLEWAPFSYPFNLTQQPACSIPCGLTADGLPVGLQIIGRRYEDSLVLRAAAAFERLSPTRNPDLPLLPGNAAQEGGGIRIG